MEHPTFHSKNITFFAESHSTKLCHSDGFQRRKLRANICLSRLFFHLSRARPHPWVQSSPQTTSPIWVQRPFCMEICHEKIGQNHVYEKSDLRFWNFGVFSGGFSNGHPTDFACIYRIRSITAKSIHSWMYLIRMDWSPDRSQQTNSPTIYLCEHAKLCVKRMRACTRSAVVALQRGHHLCRLWFAGSFVCVQTAWQWNVI